MTAEGLRATGAFVARPVAVQRRIGLVRHRRKPRA